MKIAKFQVDVEGVPVGKWNVLKRVGASALVLGLCLSSQAALYTFPSGTINTVIPDGNLSGISFNMVASGMETSISSVSIKLNLSGGYNGDLYAYLSYNGALIPLLNRVGATAGNDFGSALSGMNITLADGGANGDIHTYAGGTAPSGTFSADGRNIDPLSSGSTFDGASRTTFDAKFGGMNPNGTWTLFFADVAGGDTSTLVSWELDITAVPEPANLALGIFGVMAAAASVGSWLRRRTADTKAEI